MIFGGFFNVKIYSKAILVYHFEISKIRIRNILLNLKGELQIKQKMQI